MRPNPHRQRYLNNVIQWAVATPHFISAKLLYASGWDDICNSGEMSESTVHQRSITIRLLNNALTSECKLDMKATVSTFQLLLGIEVLMGNDENFSRLQDICCTLTTGVSQTNDRHWEQLFLSLSIVAQANYLRIAGENKPMTRQYQSSTLLKLQPNFQFTSPFDVSIFTFGQPASAEENHLAYILLGDIYHLSSIGRNCRHTKIDQSTYEYVDSQRRHMLKQVEAASLTDSGIHALVGDDNDCDLGIMPLKLSMLLLSSWLLFGTAGNMRQSLVAVASQLRRTLTIIGTQKEYHGANIALFPGALIWCYAMGLRFSNPKRDQKWFLVQFLSTTHKWMPEASNNLSKSIQTIFTCLVDTRNPTLICSD
ncbi:hypothetical protein B0O99DRAFT_304920 [Bisporella sp. PMI_857]|nr:hypothetical protein B0O99DRAFT_304920 [Bisporella sp. PMI_857]